MDELQKCLQKREKLSPSPSLIAEPPTTIDDLKMYARSLFRKVKRHTSEDANPLKPYSLKGISSFDVENARSDHWEIRDDRRKLNYLTSRIGDILSGEIINWKTIYKAYEALKDRWANEGYEFDQNSNYLNGLRSIFERRAQKCLDARVDEVRMYAEMGNLDAGTYKVLVGEVEFWGRDGIRPHVAPEEILDIYLQSPNKATLREVPPGTYIAHMLSEGSRTSLNNNPLLKSSERNNNWEYFGNKALDLRPSVSCVAFTAEEPFKRRFFSPVGILLKKGTVLDASGNDGISTPIRTDVRLSLAAKAGTVRQRLANALAYEPNTHREIIIGSNWEPEAIFYEGAMTSPEEIEKAKSIAVRHGVPLYEFIQNNGFKNKSLIN